MPSNPIQLGEQVVEHFHRYLRTYFPIADQRIERQVNAALAAGPNKRETASLLLRQPPPICGEVCSPLKVPFSAAALWPTVK